jgi:hypothetical protein
MPDTTDPATDPVPRRPVITDGQARTIASDWHGGQASALYALASSGAIPDVEAVRREISTDLATVDVGKERRPLLALDTYVREAGQRDRQPGWASLWDATPPTLAEC